MIEPEERSVSYKPRNRWVVVGKQRLARLLAKLPILRALSYRCRTAYLRFKSRIESAIYGRKLGGIDIHKTFWISPEEIEYCSLKEFSINQFRGRVIPGDWDKLEKKFEELDVYLAFEEVFFRGKTWSETVFYQRILGRVEAGEMLWGCANKVDLDRRCRGLEELFHRIKTGGYKSQVELARSQGDFVREAPEVTINIGRKGDLLFSASAHRLSIAKLLGIEKIPVQIAVRHPGWMQFREELARGADLSAGDRDRMLSHPDLEDLDLRARTS